MSPLTIRLFEKFLSILAMVDVLAHGSLAFCREVSARKDAAEVAK